MVNKQLNMINKNKQRLFEVMGHLDKTFKPVLNEQMDIDESGFARVKQMMHGLVPNVNTIGILSAGNPSGQKLSPEENNKRHQMLKDKLRTLGNGFIEPDYGMYDIKEKSLIVPNINKNDLIKLSNIFAQESCIFGEKNQDEQGVYFKWQYIEHGVTQGEQTVYTNLAGQDVQSSDNYYTQIKGRKFKIPFFGDDEYKEPKPEFKYKSDEPSKNFDTSMKSNN